MVRFLVGQPIAFVREIKALIITDLHIGIEHELYKSGIYIPSQAESFAHQINSAAKKTKAKRLVILGDVKHEITKASKRELKEIPKFFDLLHETFNEIHVTKGNHDGNLEEIVPNYVKVHGSRGFRIKNYGFFHGHALPKEEVLKCKWIFTGHLQPVIELKDLFGAKLLERVWLKGKLKARKRGNLLVVPSFNKLAGFMVVNRDEINDSVLNKLVEVDNLEVYTLDGTYLGKISSLKPSS